MFMQSLSLSFAMLFYLCPRTLRKLFSDPLALFLLDTDMVCWHRAALSDDVRNSCLKMCSCVSIRMLLTTSHNVVFVRAHGRNVAQNAGKAVCFYLLTL